MDARSFTRRWRWPLRAAFVLPLAVVLLAGSRLVEGSVAWTPAEQRWRISLGWSGDLLQALLLIGAVAVLMNLEWTFRAASGSMRWRIKYMLLGVGAVMAVQVYVSSQTLLLSTLDTALGQIQSGALLVADALIGFLLVRSSRLDETEVHVGPSTLYSSVSVIAVSVYLLSAGLVPIAAGYLGESYTLSIGAFSIFLAALVLCAILLSDRLRRHLRGYFQRTFARPQYDYRRTWLEFTERTSSAVDLRTLCASVARLVSDTFGVPSVTVWLLDEGGSRLKLAGSTVFSEKRDPPADDAVVAFLAALADRTEPVDLWRDPDPRAGRLREVHAAFLGRARIRWAIALLAGRERLGFMTLSERTTKAALTGEDCDLLKTIANQAAASLLHIRQSEWLLRAKEMEAFQSLSAFFVHDLKNLASTLSMTMQNLPRHYQDPAFRDDLLHVIERSVSKIDAMCSRLSPLSRRLEIACSPADLNQVTGQALAGLDVRLRERIVVETSPLPLLPLDPEQVQKVLVNLVLNAAEAIAATDGAGRPGGGEIRLRTSRENGWAIVSVSDTGCGMSEEFIAHSLFQPFQTTKKQGLGIGLYHSRKIVEAHAGRMEVASTPGQGSTFRVLFPLAAGETAVER
jgi:putative PEP-CTERM system histidine kinase